MISPSDLLGLLLLQVVGFPPKVILFHPAECSGSRCWQWPFQSWLTCYAGRETIRVVFTATVTCLAFTTAALGENPASP